MLETIQDFGKNLTAEVMDVPRNLRDLIGGTVAMTIIDNTPLEGIINGAADMVPGSPEQKQTVVMPPRGSSVDHVRENYVINLLYCSITYDAV